MSSPVISIIVPVFNTEKYINKCLDSILAQTLTDWECILVDDGSPDNSGAICDEYAAKDARFKVIHKENGGVAMARQKGVEASTGEYIIHADPDDYVECNMLQEMLDEIVQLNVDILVTDFFKDKEDGSIIVYKQEFHGTSTKEMIEMILSDKLHGSLWNKMVKRSSYVNAAPKFFSGINYCEDVLIWAQLASHDLKVGYLPKPYYHYVYNKDSITSCFSRKNFETRKLYINKLSEFITDKSTLGKIAFRYKARAVQNNVISRQEYYSYMPTSFSDVMASPVTVYRIFGIVAYFRLFYLGKLFFSLCDIIFKFL